MRTRHLLPLVAFSVALLTACDGSRETAAVKLDAPQTTLAEAALCDAPQAELQGLVSYHNHDGSCRRSFTGLGTPGTAATTFSDARKRALATTPVRNVTPDELFDWAERVYPQYFPSHRTNLQFAGYTYRYYPETQNYAAVLGDQIFVQGPVSGGPLAFVGTVPQFSCTVDPSLCGDGGRPCNAIAQWNVGIIVCSPNGNQAGQVSSGTTLTYLDSEGNTQGSATYTCNNGTLTPQGLPSCSLTQPSPCNTAGISWVVGASTCTPDAGSPATIGHGSSLTLNDTTDTVGAATYSCSNGVLTRVAATCSTPMPMAACPLPGSWNWNVGGAACFADQVPAQIPHGGSYTFIDSTGDPTGVDTLHCSNGILSRRNDNPALCQSVPRVLDSFGGDGGAADGGASGDGTAGDGAPIVGGSVTVADTTGRVATTTTDSRGYYRVRLTGMVPPLIITVVKPDGKVRRSVSTQAIRVNAYIFMAVSGLTDKVVSDVATAAGLPSPAALTPNRMAALTNELAGATAALRNNTTVRPEILAAGLNPNTMDFFATPYRADGTGYDKVLDNLIFDTDANGFVTVRPASCPAPQSWTVGNNTCTPDSGEETVIPSGTSIIHQDSVGSTRGSVSYSCVRGVIQQALPNCNFVGPSN